MACSIAYTARVLSNAYALLCTPFCTFFWTQNAPHLRICARALEQLNPACLDTGCAGCAGAHTAGQTCQMCMHDFCRMCMHCCALPPVGHAGGCTAVMLEELGPEAETIFSRFDRNATAAASLAQ
eukprot:299031-Pelagomonas_calceolata.AAC.1